MLCLASPLHCLRFFQHLSYKKHPCFFSFPFKYINILPSYSLVCFLMHCFQDVDFSEKIREKLSLAVGHQVQAPDLGMKPFWFPFGVFGEVWKPEEDNRSVCLLVLLQNTLQKCQKLCTTFSRALFKSPMLPNLHENTFLDFHQRLPFDRS